MIMITKTCVETHSIISLKVQHRRGASSYDGSEQLYSGQNKKWALLSTFSHNWDLWTLVLCNASCSLTLIANV